MSPANPDSQPRGDEGETGAGDGDAGPPAASATPRPEPQYPTQTWPPPYPAYPQVPAGRRRPGRALLTGAAVVLALVVLGVPLGLLWTALAPAVPVIKVDGGVQPVQPQPEELIAADGWFSLLGLGFGVLAAIVVWLVVRRYRGPIGLIAVGLGGLGAAVVAWRVGRLVGLDTYHHLLASAPVDTAFTKPPDLRAGRFEWLYGFIPTVQGDLLLPAFGAIVTYTLLAGWSRWPSLRPEPVSADGWAMALPTPGGGLPAGAGATGPALPPGVAAPGVAAPGGPAAGAAAPDASAGATGSAPGEAGSGPAATGPGATAAAATGSAEGTTGAGGGGSAPEVGEPAGERTAAGRAGADAAGSDPTGADAPGSDPTASSTAGADPAGAGSTSSGSAERPAPSAAPAPPGPDAAAPPRD